MQCFYTNENILTKYYILVFKSSIYKAIKWFVNGELTKYTCFYTGHGCGVILTIQEKTWLVEVALLMLFSSYMRRVRDRWSFAAILLVN